MLHCEHLKDRYCDDCVKELNEAHADAAAARDRAEEHAADLEHRVNELLADRRDADGFAAMLPAEGFLPDLPAGWKGEVTHYADQSLCQLRVTSPSDGVWTIDLRSLPALYLNALAETKREVPA